MPAGKLDNFANYLFSNKYSKINWMIPLGSFKIYSKKRGKNLSFYSIVAKPNIYKKEAKSIGFLLSKNIKKKQYFIPSDLILIVLRKIYSNILVVH